MRMLWHARVHVKYIGLPADGNWSFPIPTPTPRPEETADCFSVCFIRLSQARDGLIARVQQGQAVFNTSVEEKWATVN